MSPTLSKLRLVVILWLVAIIKFYRVCMHKQLINHHIIIITTNYIV